MDSTSDLQELKARVALACRVLAHLKLADYLGHVSLRLAGQERAVISPRGHAVGGLDAFTAAEMLVIDLDGRRIEGDHPVPSEVYLHTEVLRARPDVQSVIHTHQPMAVAFGLSGRPLQAVHVTGSELFDDPVPVYDHANLITDASKGRRVAEALGQHTLLLLRGHGIVSSGASPEEAAINAIYLEQQAAHAHRALQLGGLKPLTPEEIQQNKEDMAQAARTAIPHGPWKYYTSLLPKP